MDVRSLSVCVCVTSLEAAGEAIAASVALGVPTWRSRVVWFESFPILCVALQILFAARGPARCGVVPPWCWYTTKCACMTKSNPWLAVTSQGDGRGGWADTLPAVVAYRALV